MDGRGEKLWPWSWSSCLKAICEQAFLGAFEAAKRTEMERDVASKFFTGLAQLRCNGHLEAFGLGGIGGMNGEMVGWTQSAKGK